MAAKRTVAKKSPAKASTAIDQQLAKYRQMRDFGITSEPAGAAKSSPASSSDLPFVIQKHAASHLHYDFRLGWNGVLKSWAVAKGPSYVVSDKRLAVQVEDHPVEYGGFEGIIPQGQYGGGTVMLWDHGTWAPQAGHEDVDAGLRSGSLKFTLHGQKMKGKWTLVRMGGRAAADAKKPNWLLIKEHDEFERPASEPSVEEAEPNSVVTGRSLEEIAASQDHVWNSKESANSGLAPQHASQSADASVQRSSRARSTKAATTPAKKREQTAPAKAPKPPAGTPKEALPTFIEPQLAMQATRPPSAPGWLHELKLDGYRIQARKQGAKVQLLTRKGLDWTHRMKTIADQIAQLPAQSALLDGEVVVLGEDGNTSFADLQAAFQEGARKELTYFIFDLLHLDGHNLRGLPLVQRKTMLAQLLESSAKSVRISEHLDSDGEAIFRKACDLHAEGIVCKRAEGKYTSGRTSDWLKVKCIREQEFVVGGFTLPSKGHAGIHGIGALLLGYYNDEGELIYAGRTGTGFTQKTHSKLRSQLEKLRQPATPFTGMAASAGKGAVWVKSQLVAQVRFATWTSDNLVRQASFKGLREDKPAIEVRREVAEATPQTQPKTKSKSKSTSSTSRGVTAKPQTPTNKKSGSSAPVRITHPDKVLDPESGLTKQQLADYYWAVASHMLPFVASRPLSLVRCPEGSTQPCFFQKHVNHMLPPGIETVEVPNAETGKPEPYITLSTPEALAGLAQIGVLEVHPWGSTNADLEHPDTIIIDLDPDASIPWSTLASSALDVRKRWKKLGLESFLKSTGGKGLHIVVPIQPQHEWSAIKQFAHNFVLELERENPNLYLTRMTKSARKDRIYLDYLRNQRGATAVAAFSPRARAGVPVSLPLHWTDLKLAEHPVFRVSDFEEWKSRLARNPWRKYAETRQRLSIDAFVRR